MPRRGLDGVPGGLLDGVGGGLFDLGHDGLSVLDDVFSEIPE
jgi:hypothetical protein